MDYPPVAPLVMMSRGQFYVLQVASQYCLRQIQAEEYAAIQAENEIREAGGLPPVSPNQQAVRLSKWTSEVSACVESQMPHVSLVSRSAPPLSILVMREAAWHAAKLLSLIPNKRGDQYSNKCIQDQFKRVDADTSWDCLCTANRTDGSLLQCLTSNGTSNLGAPFLYENSYPIDSDEGNCDVDWPNCFDWARIGKYEEGMEVSKSTGPSTGAAIDAFDQLGRALIDYISESLSYTFLLFANVSGSSLTACPFGTMAATDGLNSVHSCVKRTAVSTLNDPDDVIVSRINPVNRGLSSQSPRGGYPYPDEEDMRFVFRVKAREFATISVDVRDLPDQVQYGRDWRIVVYSGDSLDPDANDPQICRDIWARFLKEQRAGASESLTPLTPMERESLLLENGCMWTRNPLGFEAFQLATGSSCPDSSSDLCFFATLTTESGKTACNPAQVVAKLHELYVHALVDIDLRVEIQIVNGLFTADRFKFIRALSVDIRSPSRAEAGTSKAFVIEIDSTESEKINYPYNSPILQSTGSLLVSSGKVSGIDANSQLGVMTRNFVSWLPRDKSVELTNCMRHPDGWEGEFLIDAGSYYTSRDSVIQTHIPFLSNCRGYGSAIPLWHLVESPVAGCSLLPPDETVAIGVLSFRGKSVGDSCELRLECMVDEVPNNKQAVNRWFEAPTGSELFKISFEAVDAETYASIDSLASGGLTAVPVILRVGAPTDGTAFKSVELRLRYWQRSATSKVITTADVYFGDFEYLGDEQSKGRAVWNYTLKVSWQSMTHIEVFNSFGFPGGFYAGYTVVIGVLLFGIAMANWGYHWLLQPGQVLNSKLLDLRYYTLIVPMLTRGLLTATVPILASLVLMLIVFLGQTTLFTISAYPCDATNPLGCKISILDSLESSWAGESPTDPNDYATRRAGRTAMVLLVLGGYLILVTMKAFIPKLVSRYYDKDPGEEEKEEERVWPPDQQIFAPLVYKRSAWFFMIASSCVVCTLILEFSYSLQFIQLWWLYTIAVLIIGKFMCWVTVGVLNDEALKIPIAVLFETVAHVVTLGSPDFYSFTLTAFMVQTAILVDRTYLTPLQQAVARGTQRTWRRLVRYAKKLSRGGNLSKNVNVNPEENNSDNEDDSLNQADASTLADRDRADAMMIYLGSFVSSTLATILAPITMLLMSLLYASTQSLNVYNISEGQALYYWAFQAGLLVFRFLVTIVSLNSAENFHEWRILDYLEYCKYRFTNRTHRWKGTSESPDESVTPFLRSLDLYAFSPQFYFAQFILSVGAIFFLLGMQVTVNNTWNVFDDQATPFIIIGGLLLLGILRIVMEVMADYLKIWFVEAKATESVTEDGGAGNVIEIAELLRNDDEEVVIKVPTSSSLFNWPLPSEGDKLGWERYRMAYLKENQLWLQAHMDHLIDGPTTVEFRKLLMDSLAKVLKESNILKLTAGPGLEVLEINALPPHEGVVRELEDERELIRGSGIELAARTWLLRARFVRFLRFSVKETGLEQLPSLGPSCESCGAKNKLSIIPQYPVPYIAQQFRIQTDMSMIWNVPMWESFYAAFTPGITICEKCAPRVTAKDIPITPEMLTIKEEAIPCRQVLDETLLALPDKPLADETMQSLKSVFEWAEFSQQPSVPVDVILRPPETAIGEATKLMAKEWVRKARASIFLRI